MENNQQFSKLLQGYVSFATWILVFIIVVVLLLFIFCLFVKYKRMAILTIFVGFLLCLVYCCFCIFPYQKDIKDEAYITYTGDFYVQECYFVNRGGNYILLSYDGLDKVVRYKALCDVSLISDDTVYNGTIVYSHNSKCLVDIQIIDENS